jgi:hypothetical protein
MFGSEEQKQEEAGGRADEAPLASQSHDTHRDLSAISL